MKKYDKVLMDTATLWSTLSSCKRKQVGAIVSKNSRILSNGYNGTVSGADNCCEDIVFGDIVEESIRVYGDEEIGRFQFAWNGHGDIDEIALDILNTKYDYKEYKEIEIMNIIPCSNGHIVLDYEIKFKHREFKLVSKTTVVHAEANAILSATKEGISLEGCSIYVTLSPCVECSKLIIQSGISKVYYKEPYKGDEGAKFLKENGIFVECTEN